MTSSDYLLRRAGPDDADALAPVAAQTFRDGWAEVIGADVAEAYIAEALTPARLRAAISDPHGYVLLAVDRGDAPVGYAILNFAGSAPACVAEIKAALLQRLYIARQWRGRGVADALLAGCAGEARQHKRDALWLHADPRNARAWRYYQKRGFADVGGDVYELPGGKANDRVRVLQKSLLPTLRAGVPGDASALAPVAARIFHDTFAARNDPDAMAAYMKQAFNPARLAEELADPDSYFLLAEHDARIIGYVKLAWASDENPDAVTGPPPVAELERFYVAHDWHGSGIAGTLMDAALEAARARGVRTLWLGVFSENARARRFYARRGFAEVGTHFFVLGDEQQTDVVMMGEVL